MHIYVKCSEVEPRAVYSTHTPSVLVTSVLPVNKMGFYINFSANIIITILHNSILYYADVTGQILKYQPYCTAVQGFNC